MNVNYDLTVESYNESEAVVEYYPFHPCYPGYFGINCHLPCHCDPSCMCDPVVGCFNCAGDSGCDLLHRDFPTCQGEAEMIEV